MDKKNVVIYHGIRDGKYDVTINGERKLMDAPSFGQATFIKNPPSFCGYQLISLERERQIRVEGWTREHDAEHVHGELADAASAYALTPDTRKTLTIFCNEKDGFPPMWPFGEQWWKPCPDDRIKELMKAGALIAAEIDRLLSTMDADSYNKLMSDADRLFDKLMYNRRINFAPLAKSKEE